MHNLNFCRQLVKQCRDLRAVPSQEPAFWQRLIDLSGASQKFLLPKGGMLIDDISMRALDDGDELRLPFKFIALEFETDTTQALGPGEVSFPKRIVFAREEEWEERRVIRVTVVAYSQAQGFWVPFPDIGLPAKGWSARARTSIGPAPVGVRSDDRAIAFNILHTDKSAALPISDYQGELTSLLDFLNALACSNVEIERSPVSASKKAMAKALPLDEYHILTIKRRDGASAGGATGSHRAPREHLRRGHVRRYDSGVKVWVSATIVNPGVGGKVSKDYRVAA